MNSFIVEFWSRIYGALRAVSLFALVRRLFPKLVTGAFVDAFDYPTFFLSTAALGLPVLVIVALASRWTAAPR